MEKQITHPKLKPSLSTEFPSAYKTNLSNSSYAISNKKISKITFCPPPQISDGNKFFLPLSKLTHPITSHNKSRTNASHFQLITKPSNIFQSDDSLSGIYKPVENIQPQRKIWSSNSTKSLKIKPISPQQILKKYAINTNYDMLSLDEFLEKVSCLPDRKKREQLLIDKIKQLVNKNKTQINKSEYSPNKARNSESPSPILLTKINETAHPENLKIRINSAYGIGDSKSNEAISLKIINKCLNSIAKNFETTPIYTIPTDTVFL